MVETTNAVVAETEETCETVKVHRKILLVEDNEMNRDMLGQRLIRRGFEVTFAADGNEAIETAGSENPELVLMDLSLPGMDGWEATRRLKANDLTSHIPVVALTANAMREDRDSAVAAGCDGYQTKPIDFANLLTTIDQLLI